jgi:lipoyl(octanoyl) transferase
MAKFELKYLGRQEYKTTWHHQQTLFQDALQAKKENRLVSNQIILVEHDPVFTLGKSADTHNILLSENFLDAPVFRIERGGDVTFHGPGQLVIYPIVDLEQFNMGLRDYVFNMEELVIRILDCFGLIGQRAKGASGVWLDVGSMSERKIAALGVKASRHITMHGIAFNINTDLSWFQKINPCGFQDKGVTSLANELGEIQDFKKIRLLVEEELNRIFI